MWKVQRELFPARRCSFTARFMRTAGSRFEKKTLVWTQCSTKQQQRVNIGERRAAEEPDMYLRRWLRPNQSKKGSELWCYIHEVTRHMTLDKLTLSNALIISTLQGDNTLNGHFIRYTCLLMQIWGLQRNVWHHPVLDISRFKDQVINQLIKQ